TIGTQHTIARRPRVPHSTRNSEKSDLPPPLDSDGWAGALRKAEAPVTRDGGVRCAKRPRHPQRGMASLPSAGGCRTILLDRIAPRRYSEFVTSPPSRNAVDAAVASSEPAAWPAPASRGEVLGSAS